MLRKMSKWLLILLLIYIVIGALAPYVRHVPAGDDTRLPESAQGERVMWVESNEDALFWRLRLIESAQEEIILSTFDFRADEAGGDVLSALYNAAERGVKVRVLIDGINGQLHFKRTAEARALAAHENADIKLYNPFNILKPWSFNPRLHDKYIMADGNAYILGGRNVNDLFLGKMSPKSSIDRELLVWREADSGGTAEEIHEYFEEIWALSCNKSVKGKAAPELLSARYEKLRFDLPEAFENVDLRACTMATGGVALLKGSPEPKNKPPVVWKQLCAAMERGQNVIIQTPYIICSEEMYADLAALTGERSIEIVTNAAENGANPWGCAELSSSMGKILDTGATLRTLSTGHSAHTKTLLIDDDISIVGSYNLDMRSTYLDTEMMLMVDCPELNAQLRAEAMGGAARIYTPDGQVRETKNRPEAVLSPALSLFYKVLHIIIYPLRFLL